MHLDVCVFRSFNSFCIKTGKRRIIHLDELNHIVRLYTYIYVCGIKTAMNGSKFRELHVHQNFVMDLHSPSIQYYFNSLH